jgi:hypothetical protein
MSLTRVVTATVYGLAVLPGPRVENSGAARAKKAKASGYGPHHYSAHDG